MTNKEFKNQIINALYESVNARQLSCKNKLTRWTELNLNEAYPKDYHEMRGKELAYDDIANTLLKVLE
jgi:hypothetical protein